MFLKSVNQWKNLIVFKVGQQLIVTLFPYSQKILSKNFKLWCVLAFLQLWVQCSIWLWENLSLYFPSTGGDCWLHLWCRCCGYPASSLPGRCLQLMLFVNRAKLCTVHNLFGDFPSINRSLLSIDIGRLCSPFQPSNLQQPMTDWYRDTKVWPFRDHSYTKTKSDS